MKLPFIDLLLTSCTVINQPLVVLIPISKAELYYLLSSSLSVYMCPWKLLRIVTSATNVSARVAAVPSHSRTFFFFCKWTSSIFNLQQQWQVLMKHRQLDTFISYSTAIGNKLRRSPSLKAKVRHIGALSSRVYLESPAAEPDLTLQVRADGIFRNY